MSKSQPKDGADAGLVRAHVRKAAAAFATDGWRASPRGLVYHAADGYWGRIDVDIGPASGSGDAARMPVELTAGAVSPYLLRVVNRIDPARPPSALYLHASVLWQVEIAYVGRATGQAPPLTIPQPTWARTGIVIGPDSAEGWFGDMFRVVVPAVARLCADRAMRDHLLETASATDFLGLRYAALLTRHMGLDRELPEIVRRAASASDAFDAVQTPPGGEVERNDRDPSMLMWTHLKFARFLSAAPS